MTAAKSTLVDPARRLVRSFVLRQGRMSAAQQRALDMLLPAWGIAFAPQTLDFASVFGRVAPVFLEIGFGMGETTAAIAAANPEHDFLGVEVHGPGVGALLNRIDAAGLANVRVIQHDAVEVVTQMIPPSSLAGVHVYLSRPVAQEAPPQAAPAAAGLRACTRAALGARRLPACGDGLGRVRAGNPGDVRR